MIQNTRRGTSFEVRGEIFKKRNIQVYVSLEKQINDIFNENSSKPEPKVLVTSSK